MGTAKKIPTIPFRKTPNFTRAARLEIPLSVLIEILHWPGFSKQSGTAGLGTLAVDSRATPPHQKCLGLTRVGPRHRLANPVHPAPAGQQSQSFEVAGH